MQEMENRARAHLQEAEPSIFNAAGGDPYMYQSGMAGVGPLQSQLYTSQFGPQQQHFMQPSIHSQMGNNGGFGGNDGAVGSEFAAQPNSGEGSMIDGVGSS